MSTAAPISFAGSQLVETRHVCAILQTCDADTSIVYSFPLLKMDWNAATRQFTSSTRVNGASTCSGWLRRGSIRRQRNTVGN